MSVLKASPYNLQNGAIIVVKVKAYNLDGWGNLSDVSVGTIVVQSQPIIAPSFTSSSSTKNSVTLNWSTLASGANEGYSTVLGYKIYLNDGTTGSLYSLASTIANQATTTTTITGLTGSITYTFKITAYNIYGESVLSSGYNVTTLNVPSKPTAPVVTMNGLNA